MDWRSTEACSASQCGRILAEQPWLKSTTIAIKALRTMAAPWPLPRAQVSRGAPWWVSLLSGVSCGAALVLLWRLLSLWRILSQRLLRPALPKAAPGTLQVAQPIAEGDRLGERLAELVTSLRGHAEETREATASLRKSVEQQQRLYQMAAADFQRKLDEACKRKVTTSRMELASESLQMLRSLVAGRSSSGSGALENGDAPKESWPRWFEKADAAVQGLLRTAGTAGEARRCIQTVSMILQNLVANPGQERYREVNLSSARFKETFSDSSAAVELLKVAGFEVSEAGLRGPERLAEAERLRDIMQDVLRDCDHRWQRSIETEAKSAKSALPSRESGGESPSFPAEADPPAAPWASQTDSRGDEATARIESCCAGPSASSQTAGASKAGSHKLNLPKCVAGERVARCRELTHDSGNLHRGRLRFGNPLADLHSLEVRPSARRAFHEAWGVPGHRDVIEAGVVGGRSIGQRDPLRENPSMSCQAAAPGRSVH
eukprot:s5837_g2.t2